MMIEHNSKGFTMIELITVIVVLSILSLFTFSFMDNAIKTHMLAKGQSTLYGEGVYIMERITRELRDAVSVDTTVVPLAPETSSTLRFTKLHTGIDPNTIVTFTQNGRNLFRNNTIIGRNINIPKDANDYGFSVMRNTASGTGDETITVKLKLTSLTDTSIPEFTIITSITPNNYGTNPYIGPSFKGDYYEVIQ